MLWKAGTPGSEGGCAEKARIHTEDGTSPCSPPYQGERPADLETGRAGPQGEGAQVTDVKEP